MDWTTCKSCEQPNLHRFMVKLFFPHCSQAYNLGLESFEVGVFDSLQNIIEMYERRAKNMCCY